MPTLARMCACREGRRALLTVVRNGMQKGSSSKSFMVSYTAEAGVVEITAQSLSELIRAAQQQWPVLRGQPVTVLDEADALVDDDNFVTYPSDSMFMIPARRAAAPAPAAAAAA